MTGQSQLASSHQIVDLELDHGDKEDGVDNHPDDDDDDGDGHLAITALSCPM